mmetsp:Transcript_24251/g.79055  ORF Transcript_24251/g.79055 Transcript_24251/m.79055 type:complete len:268 (-) Transcript_24251:2308-3111(-)
MAAFAWCARTLWSTASEPASPKKTGRSMARPAATRSLRTSSATKGMSCSERNCAMSCPTRPKPAMMMWSLRSSTSPCWGWSAETSAPLPRRSRRYPPPMASHGVIAMLSATTSVSWLLSATDMMPLLTACWNVTKANSPPGARKAPARTEASTERPKTGPTTASTASLPKMSAAIKPRMGTMLFTRRLRSIVMPIVMKKRPRRSPRNGAMSASTCSAYSVSATRSPARKAPSSIESPIWSVNKARPRRTSSVVAAKISALFSREIMR